MNRRKDAKEIRTLREWRAATELERFRILKDADPNYYRLTPHAQADVCRGVMARFTADTLEPTESAAEYARRVRSEGMVAR